MMKHYNLGILRVHPRFIGEGEPENKPADKTYTQAELDAAVSGLKNKNTELLGKLANSKIKDLPEDATPEEIVEAVRTKREARTKELEAKGQWEALAKELGEKHTTELRARDEKITQKEQRIQKREKEVAVKDAIRELEGKEQWLMPHVMPQLKVEELASGDYDVFIADANGNAVMKSDGTRKRPKDLLSELREKDEWKDAFYAPNVSGSGARGGSNQSAGGGVRLSRAEGKDPVKYRAAKELAAKNGGEIIWVD